MSKRVFAFHAYDSPDAGGVREQFLDEHLAYVSAHIDRYFVAGPLKNTADEMIGSLFLVYGDDEADARAFMAGDPYMREPLFDEVRVDEFVGAAGDAVGGTAWLEA